jgi:hypothetical protein
LLTSLTINVISSGVAAAANLVGFFWMSAIVFRYKLICVVLIVLFFINAINAVADIWNSSIQAQATNKLVLCFACALIIAKYIVPHAGSK